MNSRLIQPSFTIVEFAEGGNPDVEKAVLPADVLADAVHFFTGFARRFGIADTLRSPVGGCL